MYLFAISAKGGLEPTLKKSCRRKLFAGIVRQAEALGLFLRGERNNYFNFSNSFAKEFALSLSISKLFLKSSFGV